MTVPSFVKNMSAFSSLSAVLLSAQQLLQTFAQNDGFQLEVLASAFGTRLDRQQLRQLGQQFEQGDFSTLPALEIRSGDELNGARGVYVAQTDTIYLAEAFLANASDDQIVAVLLEEIGHGLDVRLNKSDSTGDEGAIFSAIVRGVELNEAQLQALKEEDDTTSVEIDGQILAAEASTITVDTLTDVTDAGDGLTSLREAITSAVSGDTITFDSSLQGGTITLGGSQLSISKNLTIDGDLNDDKTPDITVDADQLSRVFRTTGSDVTLRGLTITGGTTTGRGGGISNGGTLTLSNSIISGNSAQDGGGVYVRDATTIVSNSLITNNYASRYGGGINNIGSTLTIDNTTISNNTAGDKDGGGIDIFDGDTVTITSSTISGNTAGRLGGGISAFDNSDVTTLIVNNSTISGNTAATRGGGIYGIRADVFVSNSTITGNSAPSNEGGGIRNTGGTVTLSNSIVANSPSGSDVRGTNGPVFNYSGVNIVEDGSLTGTDIINEDPRLGDLQNNGGDTLTHALLSGSPAINAGEGTALSTEVDLGIDVDGDGTVENTAISVDQRRSDFDRIFGTAMDVGAFELQNEVPIISILLAPVVGEDSTDEMISGIAIADGDSDDQSVIMGITNGTVSLNGTTGLSFTFGDGTDDSTLFFSGSLADVNTALNDLTFTPTADFNGTASIQIQTTDTPGYSDTETLSITVNDAPEVSSLAIGDTSPTNASSVTFDVTFSESVTGVDTTDVALATTGTATGTLASVSGSGASYTVTVNSLSGDGTLGLNLVDDDTIVNGNSVALSGTGTSGSGDGSFIGGTYTIDTTVPAAPATPVLAVTSDTGSSNSDNITASTTPALTGTAEANSTVTVTSDVDGVIGSAIADGSGNWAIVASTLTAGNHSITATATDAFGNVSTVSSALGITVDATAPTVAIGSTASTLTNASPIPVTLTFSEVVSDFVIGDVTVGNGTASNFTTSDNQTFTLDVTPTGDGTVTVDVAANVAQDTAGNNNTAATQLAISSDRTAPTLTSFVRQTPADSTTNTDSLVFLASFSEDVQNVDTADFTIDSSSTATITNINQTSASTYEVTLSGGDLASFNGTVGLNLAGGQNITDNVGNALPAGEPTTDETYSIDNTAPTVTLTSAATDPINSTFSVTATFNEATSDFTDADISLTNGSLSNFSGSGTTYTFDVTPTTDGAVDVDIASGVATDTAGNNNTAATTLSRTFDATAPTVSLTSAAADPINSTFSVTATFSEATSDFTDADISLTNGSLSNFSGTGTTYTFDVTPAIDGAVDVDIAGGVATDTAGNNNTAAITLSRTFDATAPTVTNVTPNLTSIIDSSVGTGTFTLTVDFSEAMNTSVTPTFTFPVEDPTNTLTLTTGSWSDSDTYIATYDVADANETVSNIDVQVSDAQDTAGNLQISSTQTDEFSINTVSTIEFAAASFTADETIITSNAVTLIRTGDTSNTASVQINIAGGTADETDYTNSSFPLTATFDPTETSKTVAIPITDDLLVEQEETILLSINGASNATIGSQATTTLTLTDNDTAGFIIDKTSVTVSEAGNTEVFNVALSSDPSSDVVLTITSSDPSEATVVPTSVTLDSTNWDTGVDVIITGEDDTEIDGDQISTLTVSVDAANSDDAFDSLSDQTLSVNTIDDDTAGLLTPVPAANALEVTSLGTDDTVRLEVDQVGVDSVSEILIFSTDASGTNRTQIGRFSLLEGGKLPAAYGPEFTVNNSAVEPGDYLQFELAENGQTRVATLTPLSDGQARLDFGEGTQPAIPNSKIRAVEVSKSL